MEKNDLIVNGLQIILNENKELKKIISELKEVIFDKEKKIEKLKCIIKSTQTISGVKLDYRILDLERRVINLEKNYNNDFGDGIGSEPENGWNDIII